MEKKVILDQSEYERLIKLASKAVMMVDKYTLDGNNGRDEHIMSIEKVDKTYYEAYCLLLFCPNEIKDDIISKLTSDYFDTDIGMQSVLSDEDDVF